MKLRKKFVALMTALTMILPVGLAGCGKSDKKDKEDSTEKVEVSTNSDATGTDSTGSDATTEGTNDNSNPDNYIDLALNVMYNDGDLSYSGNEVGETVHVTGEGQYTVTFDCSKDLSDAAKEKGVTSIQNLTAVYILDAGVAAGAQSPLKSCDIMYDKVDVDGTELKVTMEAPKPAFKPSGVFDTNDPINSWEGSCLEGVEDDFDNHVSKITAVENPTKMSVTFTLSNMVWGDDSANQGGESVQSTNTYVNNAKFSDIDFTSMNALELTKYLGNGINLGNTMEATNGGAGKKAEVSMYETAWGQPETTQAMIQGMKNCGFDTIRIPVSWTNMMDYENGDFNIDTRLLDRVETIVDWALDAEMFVVLNDHWDSGWWDMFAGNDDEVALAWKIHENMWTQVADRFKDKSDMLILESANEELGRAWTNKGMEEDVAYKLITEVNQKFVDIVRASGGNNDDRFLLIAGNATDINLTIDDKYVMPKDTVEGKLFISVHYYDPWNYCGDKDADSEEALAQYKWGLKEEYEYMYQQVPKMKKFTDAGYGVIIGEYGALPAWINNKSYELPNSIEYTDAFLNVCDVNNYCPVLWATGGYDKQALNMLSDETTALYTSRCYAEETANESYLDDVKKEMDDSLAAAPEVWPGQETYEPGTSVAWIMYAGGTHQYSVGDKFNSADCKGTTATNVVVEGAGTYTVSLDFDGGMDGLMFSALAIADGEINYPGAKIEIKEITLDGTPVEIGNYYTSSDDKKCTRVNLYNNYITDKSVQKQAQEPDTNIRTLSGDLSNITPIPVDPTAFNGPKNLTITFDLITE